jgi:hypothetical protein
MTAKPKRYLCPKCGAMHELFEDCDPTLDDFADEDE